jgi:ectoine hydroxylase-related dioxygenase (phytanoyl-CoA dioxygenase family)
VDTATALRHLGAPATIGAEERERLDRDGFVVLPGVLDAATCAAMSAAFDEMTAGVPGPVVDPEEGVRRLSDLFNRSAVFDPLLTMGPVLAGSAALLGEIKLHGANVRMPLEGHGRQPLHSDVPKAHPADWRVTNALVALDEVTTGNGPTRVVPGSHLWPHMGASEVNSEAGEPLDGDYGETWRFPADRLAAYPGEVLVTLPVGSVALCNASLWHGGTTNATGAARRVAHITWTRRDHKQQFRQQDRLTPGLWSRLPPALRYLLDVEAP